MSTKTVIIALLVALVLGIGAYLVLQPGAKPAAKPNLFATGDQVCKVEPGAVSEIEIETPNGEIQTVRRAGTGLPGYFLSIGRQTTQQGPSWPLEEGRVPSLLRVLNNARSLGAPDEKAELDADSLRVTIREEGGAVTHMLLSGRSLAGRGLVKIVTSTSGERLTLSELRARPGKLAVIDDAIHNVFRNPGPRAWRDTVAMPGMGPDVSRLRLTNNDLSTRLARVEGKWVVQEPVSAPADATLVGKLINTLGTLRITSFGDEPNAPSHAEADTGLAQPIAIIVSETDRRTLSTDPAKAGDVSVKTETRELFVGKPADAGAQTRFARLGKDGPVVVISGAGLARELFDAAGYVSKKAVQAPAADIGMLVIEGAAPEAAAAPAPGAPGAPGAPPAPAAPLGRVFRRDLDKWKEVTGTTETTLDETMTKAVEELVKFLTVEEAQSLALAPPAVWKEQGHLIVGSIGGTPLETIVLGASDGAGLGVRTGGEAGKGGVYRWYQRERVPRILTALLPKPTEAVKAPAGEKEVVK